MKAVLPLQVVGTVPFRPIGKSHFKHAPWNIEERGVRYVPSDMSVEALKNSIVKYAREVKPYTEQQLDKAEQYLFDKMKPFWSGSKVWDQREAIDDCDLSKGSGHPYHYYAPNKELALDMFAEDIERNVNAVLSGDETVEMPSSLTLKDELRTEERVKAHKTRAFNASNFIHLLASKRLFGDQNNRIHANRGQHPITLGISVPGDEFVSAILRLGKRSYDADGDGYDLRVNLGLMRVIRNVRKRFLPECYHKAVDLLYDAIYCGDTITAGVIYRMICQKSGWENTSDDNSLHLWLALFLAYDELGLNFDDSFAMINGDDLAYGDPLDCPITIVDVARVLSQYGIHIVTEHPEPRDCFDLTFLSHHLVERCLVPFGDIVVAAGNRDKLLSSLNWVRMNDNLSFEESCLAHLLGIRLCLWPWRFEFLEVDDLIDSFLESMSVKSPLVKQLLKARLTEEHIASIHLSLEGGFCFSPLSILHEVDQVTYGLIKEVISSVCC